MKSLKLFNAVIAKTDESTIGQIYMSEKGYIVRNEGFWALPEITKYYHDLELTGEQLNKTFHKSWKEIKESSDYVLYKDQIRHYISTYGSDFEDDIYIPEEILNIPNLNLTYKVIKTLSKKELTFKALSMLQAGIALTEETIKDLIDLLVHDLEYKFTGLEQIKNREAIVLIADLFNVYPIYTVDFFRYIIFKASDQTLLIKSDDLIETIKENGFNPEKLFINYGIKKLGSIFNRFKPLFLAFKPVCPTIINKISKASKKVHKPLYAHPLNNVTQKLLSLSDITLIQNSTPFALFRALNICYSISRGQETFLYRIRNGKSWVNTVDSTEEKLMICNVNYHYLLDVLRKKINLKDLKVYIPKGVNYALPTSEKMFIGNVPTGTSFTSKKMAVGIYWENEFGANDLDLSAINVMGKVGWNSNYNQENKLFYSGDITDAPDGAVEYLYASDKLEYPSIVLNNVFSGDSKSGYNIIIGKGDNIKADYMMNPNNLFLNEKTTSVQKETVLGFFLKTKKGQKFVLTNVGAGNRSLSGNNEITHQTINALYQQWTNTVSLKKMIKMLGGKIVKKPDESNLDLSLETLSKDTIINIFN